MKLLHTPSNLESDNGKSKGPMELYGCRAREDDLDSSTSSSICLSVESSLEDVDYGYGEGSPDSERQLDLDKASVPLGNRSRHYARPSRSHSSHAKPEDERLPLPRGSLLSSEKCTRIVADPHRSNIRRRTSSRSCRSSDTTDKTKTLRRGVSRSRSSDDSLVAMARSVSRETSRATERRSVALRTKSCEDRLLIMARSMSERRLPAETDHQADLGAAAIEYLPVQSVRTVRRGLSRSNSSDGSRRSLVRTRSSARSSRYEPSRGETVRSRSCQSSLEVMSRSVSEHKPSPARAPLRRSDSTRSLRVQVPVHDPLLGPRSSNHMTKPRPDESDDSEDESEESVSFHDDSSDDPLATSLASPVPEESLFELSLSHVEEVDQWFTQRKFQRYMEAERAFQQHQRGASYVPIREPSDLLSAPALSIGDIYCGQRLGKLEGEDPRAYAAAVQLDVLKPDAVEVLVTRVVAQDDDVEASDRGISNRRLLDEDDDECDSCFSGRHSAATDNHLRATDSLSGLLRKSMFKRLLRGVPAGPDPAVPGYWQTPSRFPTTAS